MLDQVVETNTFITLVLILILMLFFNDPVQFHLFTLYNNNQKMNTTNEIPFDAVTKERLAVKVWDEITEP